MRTENSWAGNMRIENSWAGNRRQGTGGREQEDREQLGREH